MCVISIFITLVYFSLLGTRGRDSNRIRIKTVSWIPVFLLYPPLARIRISRLNTPAGTSNTYIIEGNVDARLAYETVETRATLIQRTCHLAASRHVRVLPRQPCL